VREHLKARAEPAERLSRVPGRALELAPFERKKGNELVRLAQVHTADDDGLGLGFHRVVGMMDSRPEHSSGTRKK
jgi:hypothetical protein